MATPSTGAALSRPNEVLATPSTGAALNRPNEVLATPSIGTATTLRWPSTTVGVTQYGACIPNFIPYRPKETTNVSSADPESVLNKLKETIALADHRTVKPTSSEALAAQTPDSLPVQATPVTPEIPVDPLHHAITESEIVSQIPRNQGELIALLLAQEAQLKVKEPVLEVRSAEPTAPVSGLQGETSTSKTESEAINTMGPTNDERPILDIELLLSNVMLQGTGTVDRSAYIEEVDSTEDDAMPLFLPSPKPSPEVDSIEDGAMPLPLPSPKPSPVRDTNDSRAPDLESARWTSLDKTVIVPGPKALDVYVEVPPPPSPVLRWRKQLSSSHDKKKQVDDKHSPPPPQNLVNSEPLIEQAVDETLETGW